jgi:hypothetical protein
MHTAIRTLTCICLAATLFSVAGADKSKKKTGPPPKYEIAGSITQMAPPHRARVVATSNNKPARSATMTADGTFTLRTVSPGSYTVRPSHSLYVFSPTFRTVSVTDHDITGLTFKAMEVPSRKGKK